LAAPPGNISSKSESKSAQPPSPLGEGGRRPGEGPFIQASRQASNPNCRLQTANCKLPAQPVLSSGTAQRL